MMSLNRQVLCAQLHCYRFRRLFGSNAKQQTDQLSQHSSRKGKYRAPRGGIHIINLSDSQTRVLLQTCFCHTTVYFLIFRALGSNFAIVPLATLHPLPDSSFSVPFGIWFLWPKTCQGYQCFFHHPSPPSDWFVCGFFLFCSLVRSALLPPVLSCLSSCSLLCLDFLTKDCQGFQLLLIPFFPP